jgi:hypothetical protein
MGSLYKQKNRDGSEDRIWWAKYYASGQAVRVSTGTDNKDQGAPVSEGARGAHRARPARAPAC